MNEKSLTKIVKSNRKKIIGDYRNMFKVLNSCIEKQNYIILNYSLRVNFSYKDDIYPILKGIVYKNSMNLHSTLELIKMGYHSSAAILLRNVFEGFIIIIEVLKYDDVKLYNQFEENFRYMNPVKNILENKEVPLNVKNEIEELWHYLCEKSHATTHSMQIGLDYDQISESSNLNNKNQIDFILGIYAMFVDINWILSNQYIFDSTCKYITEESYRLENNYNQFIYKYNSVEKLSKIYRDLYTDYANIFIKFLE